MRPTRCSLVAFTRFACGTAIACAALLACGAEVNGEGTSVKGGKALADGEGTTSNGNATTPDGESPTTDGDGTVPNGDGTNAEDDSSVANDDDDSTHVCIAENPPAEPFDVGDIVLASPPPGSTEPAPPGPTADTIAAECVASGGTGCDPASFISKVAALCLAEFNEFPTGLEPWSAALVYHYGHERVVWNVTNLVRDDGPDGYWGNIMTFDATDGSFIELLGYGAIP